MTVTANAKSGDVVIVAVSVAGAENIRPADLSAFDDYDIDRDARGARHRHSGKVPR